MPTADELGIESVQAILEDVFGLEGRIRGDEFGIICPNPNHVDTRPSTDINLGTGLWSCFSCGVGGDLVELGLFVFELPRKTWKDKKDSRKQVEEKIKPQTVDALRVIVGRKLANAVPRRHSRRQQEARPGSALGPYDSGPLSYLRARGFEQETLRRWNVQFVPVETLESRDGNLFQITSSIGIPIKDQQGRLLNWCFRATDSSEDWQPRYLYPKDAELSELWFGLQHHHDSREISIVEGALDTMWLDQCGFPALGLLGSSMGDRKILQLQRYQKVTLFGDRDTGGIAWVNRVGKMIGDRVAVRIARYPQWVGDDPQELHALDVELMHERAIPWTTWVMMHSAKDAG